MKTRCCSIASRLAEMGPELLRPGGSSYREINEERGAGTAALLTAQGFEDVRALPDMFGRARLVCGQLA